MVRGAPAATAPVTADVATTRGRERGRRRDDRSREGPFVVRRVPVRGKGTCDAVHLSLHGRARSLRGRAPLVPAGRRARPPLTGDAVRPSSSPGAPRSGRSPPRRPRSPGEPRPAGTTARFAPTTSSAASSPPRSSARARCCAPACASPGPRRSSTPVSRWASPWRCRSIRPSPAARSPTRPTISRSSRRGALALVGNVGGTVAAVGVAVAGLAPPAASATALIIAGVVVAAVGSALAGLGDGGGAVFTAVAAVLLYAGFVSRGALVAHLRHAARVVDPPAPLAEPDPAEEDDERDDDRRLDRERDPLAWCAISRGRGPIGLRPCRAPSARASRTASGARHGAPGRS